MGGQTSRTPLGLITQLSVCTQLWKRKALSYMLLWCIIVISAAIVINHNVLFPKPLSLPSLIYPSFLLLRPVCPPHVLPSHCLWRLSFFNSASHRLLFSSPTSCKSWNLFINWGEKRHVRLALMVLDVAQGVLDGFTVGQ